MVILPHIDDTMSDAHTSSHLWHYDRWSSFPSLMTLCRMFILLHTADTMSDDHTSSHLWHYDRWSSFSSLMTLCWMFILLHTADTMSDVHTSSHLWHYDRWSYCCCRPHSTNVLPAESSTRIMWQPTVSPPRWQGKAPLCRDSSRGPG